MPLYKQLGCLIRTSIRRISSRTSNGSEREGTNLITLDLYTPI